MTPARERLLVVLGLLLLAGVGVLASTRTFSVVDLAGAQPLAVTGAQAAPALAPLAIAQLALAVALTIAGPVARAALGVLLVVLGAAVVALMLPVVLDPATGTRAAVSAATGLTGGTGSVRQVTGSAWPVVAAVAGAIGALLGLLVVARTRRWTTAGRRFRQPAAAPAVGTDAVSEWDALSRGGDPTEDPGPPDRAL